LYNGRSPAQSSPFKYMRTRWIADFVIACSFPDGMADFPT
jgi:hypothetical protein